MAAYQWGLFYLKQNELNEAQKNQSEQSEEDHSADLCNFEVWWSHLESGSSYGVWMSSQQKDAEQKTWPRKDLPL